MDDRALRTVELIKLHSVSNHCFRCSVERSKLPMVFLENRLKMLFTIRKPHTDFEVFSSKKLSLLLRNQKILFTFD